MRYIVFRVLAFVAAVVTATVLACLFQTQFVIAALNDAGTDITLMERLTMTGYDIAHLGRLYSAFIALGLLAAFLASGLVFKMAKTKRTLIYVAAGGVCFLVMLALMKMVFFGVPIIAGARTGIGLAFQALAGGISGYLFARLTAPGPTADKT